MKSEEQMRNKWAAARRRFAVDGTKSMWPSETPVRLFKGDYIPGLNRDYAGKKVVDVGFGNGNNLMFPGSLGLSLYGTELREEICGMVGKKLEQLGYEADLQAGTNRQLPFPDNGFGFLECCLSRGQRTGGSRSRSGILQGARTEKALFRLDDRSRTQDPAGQRCPWRTSLPHRSRRRLSQMVRVLLFRGLELRIVLLFGMLLRCVGGSDTRSPLNGDFRVACRHEG